ncbi:MAG: N-acetyltransferase [Proteobacteria bacterium]|nr:N-acetyltransferase [Pseudomonadota bacterium]
MFPLTPSAFVRPEKARDAARIEALLNAAFGIDRRQKKTVYKLRDGVDPVRELSYVVEYKEGAGGLRDSGTDEKLSSESQGLQAPQPLSPPAPSSGNEVAATIRYWPILLPSGAAGLLLGPIAVDEARQAEGIGASLMTFSMGQARALGYSSMLLVGDETYYGRFGFSRGVTKNLQLPGPVEEERFLGLEWAPGALSNEQGVIRKWPPGKLLPHYKK